MDQCARGGCYWNRWRGFSEEPRVPSEMEGKEGRLVKMPSRDKDSSLSFMWQWAHLEIESMTLISPSTFVLTSDTIDSKETGHIRVVVHWKVQGQSLSSSLLDQMDAAAQDVAMARCNPEGGGHFTHSTELPGLAADGQQGRKRES